MSDDIATPRSALSPIHLYAQPFHQSPTRGEPGELLTLAGYGFMPGDQVVYRILDGTETLDGNGLPNHPPHVPSTNTGSTGTAEVVASDMLSGAPSYALTVALPEAMVEHHTYALWVSRRLRGAGGTVWSNPALINDVRPLWVSPSYAYATESIAEMRRIKVVGRNLGAQYSPAGDLAPRQIRLTKTTAPHEEYVVLSTHDPDPDAATPHYVIESELPNSMAVGEYTVAVSADDAFRWTQVEDQRFYVRPDPVALAVPVSTAAGSCIANDGIDDTQCIIDRFATAPAGSTVVFAAGQYDLADPDDVVKNTQYGIVVPAGVSLRGAPGHTIFARDEDWRGTLLTLRGNELDGDDVPSGSTTVSGITFQATRDWAQDLPYGPGDPHAITRSAALRLGTNRADMGTVRDIVIYDNRFLGSERGVALDGIPISELVISDNTFGTFHHGLLFDGNRTTLSNAGDVEPHFNVVDTVITNNTFLPGAYELDDGNSGTIATEIGASRRLDLSHNEMDGLNTEYIGTSRRGFRAASFHHLNNNQEMLLVSNNTMRCISKTGDGEAVGMDNNANISGFAEPANAVVEADPDTVALAEPFVEAQEYTLTDTVAPTFYDEHWVFVVEGKGLGQARKIQWVDPDKMFDAPVIGISPPWDVVPGPGSKVVVARTYWQTIVVDNVINNDYPACLGSPKKGAGRIAFAAQFSDSVVDSNEQTSSDGVYLSHNYSAKGHSPVCVAHLTPCVPVECNDAPCEKGVCIPSDDDPDHHICASPRETVVSLGFFSDVRNNTIDQEYTWASPCSDSGVQILIDAANVSPPPTLGFGLSVKNNQISHADGRGGGAIVVATGGAVGPYVGAGAPWKLLRSALFSRNVISDIPLGPPAADPECQLPFNRVGIRFLQPQSWFSVLEGNVFSGVAVPLDIGSAQHVTQVP